MRERENTQRRACELKKKKKKEEVVFITKMPLDIRNGEQKTHLSCFPKIVRASALDNAKPKYKGNLAFQTPNSSPSGNATAKYCKFFYNSATVQF